MTYRQMLERRVEARTAGRAEWRILHRAMRWEAGGRALIGPIPDSLFQPAALAAAMRDLNRSAERFFASMRDLGDRVSRLAVEFAGLAPLLPPRPPLWQFWRRR